MARTKETVQLQDSDWETLFPGVEFTIGTTKLKLQPLALEDISLILKKVTMITSQLSDLNLSMTDLTENSLKIVQLVELIVDEAPDILSQMSGLKESDVRALPLATSVELFNAALDVNIKSQEDLVKNFKGLADRFKTFTNPTARATLPEVKEEILQ